MKKAILAFLAILPLFANQVHATGYTYSDTIDLGSVSNQQTWNWNLNAPAFSFYIGDTLSGTITFANNESLQFNNLGGGSFHIFTKLFSPVNVNMGDISLSTTLDGLQGTINGSTRNISTQPGLTMEFADFGTTADGSISITGFHYTATINSINGGVFNSQTGGFLTAQIVTGSGSLSVVPEPSTYALFGLGALALVVAYRRKVA
jgi:hypothetical protein